MVWEFEHVSAPKDHLSDLMVSKYPWLSFVITAVYVWFVKVSGPNIMESRTPFKIVNVIRLYNVMQIVMNTYIVSKAMYIEPEIISDYWKYHCHYTNAHNIASYKQFGDLMLLIGLSKLLDLFDSVFMVLKKKNKQLSFLHVYHHGVVVILMAYAIANRDAAGGTVVFLNAFVHSLMYTYYFLSSFPSLRPMINRYKPMMTMIQIIQLIMIILFLGSLLYRGCSISIWTSTLTIASVATFLFLFIQFYMKSYKKLKK